jgi:hypothetical protein
MHRVFRRRPPRFPRELTPVKHFIQPPGLYLQKPQSPASVGKPLALPQAVDGLLQGFDAHHRLPKALKRVSALVR